MKILDIGANDGWWYRTMKVQYPTANFILIEANPYNESALKKLGVDYRIACLSDTVKTVQFYTTKSAPTSTGASYYKEDTEYFNGSDLDILELTTTTLDILFPAEIFEFIKMDVQGAEVDIINGGKTLVSKANKVLLEVPVQGVHYNIGAPMRSEYFKIMQELGFTKFTVVENINNIQEDILFTK